MAQNNMSVPELTALVENIVAQVMNKSFGGQLASWAANNSRSSLYLSHENGDRGYGDNGIQITNELYKFGKIITEMSNNHITPGINSFGGALMGVAGIASAYQSGDALNGALSGFELFGTPLGAAVGLLAGLFSPGIDRWQRPKFKDAKQSADKLFTMDRGERDEYYLPDSFYFRAGGQGARKITVHVGNDQFDEHIRESLTTNYASQLQRGLVF